MCGHNKSRAMPAAKSATRFCVLALLVSSIELAVPTAAAVSDAPVIEADGKDLVLATPEDGKIIFQAGSDEVRNHQRAYELVTVALP